LFALSFTAPLDCASLSLDCSAGLNHVALNNNTDYDKGHDEPEHRNSTKFDVPERGDKPSRWDHHHQRNTQATPGRGIVDFTGAR
jgi:hypothetical protein